jgi:hypothetical protein
MGGNCQVPVGANSCQRAYWQSKRANCDTSSRETNECFGYLRMKTQTMVIVLGLAAAAATSFGRLPQAGQTQAPLPSDLVQISSNQVPGSCGNLYSMAYWPVWPPLPAGFAQVPGYSLYYSPSMNSVFLDDRAAVAGAAMMNFSESGWSFWPPGGGDTNAYDPGVSLGPAYNYKDDHTNLYLMIPPPVYATNAFLVWPTNYVTNTIPVWLVNTRPGTNYEVLSSVEMTNQAPLWQSEGIWLATDTNTLASIPKGAHTNKWFFDARVWNGTFQTNGQLFVKASTDTIYPVINGVTNTVVVPPGGWAPLNRLSNGPIYQVNLGYGSNDDGYIGGWVTTRPQQNITALAGYSATITNLCLATNPITSLSVAGWPQLQDLECWQCWSLASVAVDHCPNLVRVCFESTAISGALNLTGCPEIADIRAASTSINDITFAGGAGPKVWHLCVHDDGSLRPSFRWDQFPLMRQLWIWNSPNLGIQSLFDSAGGTDNTLEWVETSNVKIDYADFSGQTHLSRVQMGFSEQSGAKTLTNLVLAGCTTLSNVYALHQSLPSSVVDAVLANCDASTVTSGGTNRIVDLRENAAPGQAGSNAAVSLNTKGWLVLVDGAAGPSECATNIAPIWFVNSSASVTMKVVVSSAAKITWYWGDGSNTCGSYVVMHSQTAGNTNRVEVDPPGAVIAFGAYGSDGCNNSAPFTTLSAVGGLTNYPNLQEVDVYETGLTTMSLAGCSNLIWLAAIASSNDSNLVSQYFIDIDAANGTTYTGTPPREPYNCSFGYSAPMIFWPSCMLTTAGLAAKDRLAGKGWHFLP